MESKELLVSSNSNKEIWKPIEGFEFYQISNHGRVKNAKGHFLKFTHNHRGYVVVYLNENGKTKTMFLHRLIAKAFIPNPNNYPEVNHIDENKDNNIIENLEWCTDKYNNRHSKAEPVDIYTKDGEYIETLGAIVDVAEKYKTNANNVYRHCRSNFPYKDYIFKYHNPQRRKELCVNQQHKIDRIGHDSNEGRYIPINEFSLDGSFIRRWSNSSFAGKAYGIHPSNIYKCLNGTISTIQGKIFLKIDDSIQERLIKMSKRRSKSKTEVKNERERILSSRS